MRINDQIKTNQVRLIDANGKQVGIVSLEQAKNAAMTSNLDLVEVTPNAKPPVCKIMDYGKYQFDQKKKEKENKKKQVIVSLKEIRLSTNIGEHDFMTKIKLAEKFLESGDKVKCSLRFKGRQITHPEVARKLFSRFQNLLERVGSVEQNPTLNGNTMIMTLQPKK